MDYIYGESFILMPKYLQLICQFNVLRIKLNKDKTVKYKSYENH